MNDVNSAIKDMFTKNRMNRNTPNINIESLNNSRNMSKNNKSLNKELENFNSFVDNLKSKGEIPDEDYQTANLFNNNLDLHDTSLK